MIAWMADKFETIDNEEAIPPHYRNLLNQTEEGKKAIKVIELLVSRHNDLTGILNESLSIIALCKLDIKFKNMQEAIALKIKAERHLLFGWLGL